MYILEECGFYKFDDTQFGFVQGRGTNMAISITQGVITYTVKRGNPVFACSLDAEGAFDAMPFQVIFHKAADVLSDGPWHVLYFWCKDMFPYDGTAAWETYFIVFY